MAAETTERARSLLPPTASATATVTALAIAVEEAKTRALSKAVQSSEAPGGKDAPGGKKQAVAIATARSQAVATAADLPSGRRSRKRPATRGGAVMALDLGRESRLGPRPPPPASWT